jgi:hypothetical protein
MGAELEAILNEMKEKSGIGGAVVRSDGVTVNSTIALNEMSSGLLASVANVSDAIMKKMEDRQEDIEVSMDGLILVIIPLKNHLFCGIVNDRKQKKIVAEYAGKAKQCL